MERKVTRMEEEKISCSKFQKKEPTIKKITEGINQAQGQEKLGWAKKLEAEVEPLLSCEDYDPESLGCQSCRLICQTRKKTAEVIIRALSLL